MGWREYVSSDPRVLQGKPVIKDTRLSVEFLLSLLAAGWSERDVLESYPSLTEESLRAVFDFAAESMRDERLFERRAS